MITYIIGLMGIKIFFLKKCEDPSEKLKISDNLISTDPQIYSLSFYYEYN